MAITDIAAQELRYGIVLQSTWGTAEADNSDLTTANNGAELSCELTNFESDVKVRELPKTHGTRRPTTQSIIQNTKGSMPKVTITGICKINEIDLLLACFFQTVTESGTTPYGSTFTMASGQPADFTNSAGYYVTFFERHPSGASKSVKLKDCIVSDLKFTMANQEMVMYEATLVGRGNLTTCTPSGTWTVSDNDVLYHSDLAICQYNSIDRILTSFEVSLHYDIVPIGYDSGEPESFAQTNFTGEFTLNILDNGGLRSLYDTDAEQGIDREVRIGWGHATPGTDENDFDIAFNGVIASPTYDHESPESLVLTGKMYDDNAGVDSPVTIITANAILRGF